MAVELDVKLTQPFDLKIIHSEIENLLYEKLRLDVKPEVRLRTEKCLSGVSSIMEDKSMFFSIENLAEVWVMPYLDPSDSTDWVSISYGHFRSVESKILCLAVAVVLANHNGVAILDEGNLFRCGTVLNPDHVFSVLNKLDEFSDFTKQATNAIRLFENRSVNSGSQPQ